MQRLARETVLCMCTAKAEEAGFLLFEGVPLPLSSEAPRGVRAVVEISAQL